MYFDEKEVDTILKALRYHLNGLNEDISCCEKTTPIFVELRGFENCQELVEIYINLVEMRKNLQKVLDKIENV